MPMANVIDKIILILFFMITLAIGLRGMRKCKDIEEYTLAKGQQSRFVVIITLIATAIGGQATIGFAAELYSNGAVFLLTALGYIACPIMFAYFIAPKIDSRFEGMLSIQDIIAYFFGKKITVLTSSVNVISLTLTISSQLVAITHISANFLGTPYLPTLCLISFLITAYSAVGGIKSISKTDVLQFFTLSVAFIMLTIFAIIKQKTIIVTPLFDVVSDGQNITKYLLLSIFFALPFRYLQPTVIQRCLMADSVKTIQKMYYSYTLARLTLILCLVVITAYALGTGAVGNNIDAKELLPYSVKHLLPVGLQGLAIAGLTAVIVSTIDSYINVGGVILYRNICRYDDGKKANSVTKAQISSATLGLVATLIATLDLNIFSVVVFTYLLTTVAISIPLFIALLGQRTNASMLLLSFASGVLTFAVMFWCSCDFYLIPIVSSLVSLLMSYSYTKFHF
jgi:Na+/proline symporter